jgi:hypothetical protein
MTHHPFYNPEDLNDMQLTEKLGELVEKRAHAFRMGMPSLVDNIEMLIAEIHMEQEKRMFKAEREYYERQGIDINAPITLGEVEEIDTRKDDNV